MINIYVHLGHNRHILIINHLLILKIIKQRLINIRNIILSYLLKLIFLHIYVCFLKFYIYFFLLFI